MKKRYIDLMERALLAYTDEHILRYWDEVTKNGLTEHGFPRLTANMGILIAHGRRTNLLPLFLEMMDFCCKTIPTVKAANDFSVREIVNCLQVVEEHGLATRKQITAWRASLTSIDPFTCYTVVAKEPTERLRFNWALFTAVSEYRRNVAGLGGTPDFIETQIATQLHHLDDFGMYRDNLDYAPMVYDLVPRGLFAILLRLGYRGKFHETISEQLKYTALQTLKMQSVTGELAFGGRSNQFMHNEAWLSMIFEFEAVRYAREGNQALAKTFKAAATLALDNVEKWLSKEPIYHVKNRFPTETKFGCERYAYFDKYMITVASFLYEAYLTCDESIAVGELDRSPVAWRTSPHFHKLFLKSGGYALEFDTNADPLYDATGLGRIHREGAPSPICMSVPCPSKPKYTVNIDQPKALSLCSGICKNGKWQYVTDGDALFDLIKYDTDKTAAYASFFCRFANSGMTAESYAVNESGVKIEINGDGEIAYMLPAFDFDGEAHTKITATEHTLEISYEGWICHYETNGKISDLGRLAANRNGHYKTFAATASDTLKITVEIKKQ